MSRQLYVDRNFKPASMRLIGLMNAIIEEYIADNYRLTVRQLYYQLVARGFIENTERSYQNTTALVNDAKLAGMMDWDAIEDRTRAFIRRSRWESAAEISRAAANNFHMDQWIGQKLRVVCIVEKEALAGVLERACHAYDVPLLAARGYPSGTVLREFCQTDVLPAIRASKAAGRMQRVIVLHLGDHDPSGIDMSRDLAKRIQLFSEDEFDVDELRRIALTMDQITAQKPPPNPAKQTDSRFTGYADKYGTKSWELDALKPHYLDKLLRQHIQKYINRRTWKARLDEIEGCRVALSAAADQFEADEL